MEGFNGRLGRLIAAQARLIEHSSGPPQVESAQSATKVAQCGHARGPMTSTTPVPTQYFLWPSPSLASIVLRASNVSRHHEIEVPRSQDARKHRIPLLTIPRQCRLGVSVPSDRSDRFLSSVSMIVGFRLSHAENRGRNGLGGNVMRRSSEGADASCCVMTFVPTLRKLGGSLSLMGG